MHHSLRYATHRTLLTNVASGGTPEASKDYLLYSAPDRSRRTVMNATFAKRYYLGKLVHICADYMPAGILAVSGYVFCFREAMKRVPALLNGLRRLQSERRGDIQANTR